MRAAALSLLLAACMDDPVRSPVPAPATAPAADRPAPDRAVLSFAAVPTQRLSEERLRRYRNAVPPGGPEVERFADATECATTARGRACIIEVPGHETIAVGEDEAAETLFTLGSSGAFSVVAINASGRHLAYGLRYDKLEGQPVKLFLVDLERIRDPTRPVDGAVRVITRGALGPPGPPNAGLRAAMAAEHNPLDGQVAAYCQVPVRLRARQPDARPDVAAYHFPCHLPASTAQAAGEDALPLALADIAFGPTDLRMIAMVASALPPATPTPPAPGG